MDAFFTLDKNKEILNSFLITFKRKQAEEAHTGVPDFRKERDLIIHEVITWIQQDPEEWDRLCPHNIHSLGSSLIMNLPTRSTLDLQNNETIDTIFSFIFCFFLEYYLSKAVENDAYKKILVFIDNNMDLFADDAKWRIKYAMQSMPISIVKNALSRPEIKDISDLSKNITLVDNKITFWEGDLAKAEKRVTLLKDSLEKYEKAFNFVGLYKGFDELSKNKLVEKNWVLCCLLILSVLIVFPALSEFLFIIGAFNTEEGITDKHTKMLTYSILPAVSITLIGIYYFRVLLSNYKSIKAQLLQIELRKTLCRFIQHYSEHAHKMKGSDPTSLEKFEDIIFSGIVADDTEIPSTYDGVEQVSKLIKLLKS